MPCRNSNDFITDGEYHMDEFKSMINQIKKISLSVEKHTYETSQKQAYVLLRKLHDAGYTKDEVYQSLLSFQATLKDSLSYDFICDLMDVVINWCSIDLQIWKDEKDSLKEFYDYLSSDEELMYDIRMHAEWSEASFIKLKQFVYVIMQEYKDKPYYPERVISYMQSIPTMIHILSQFKKCSQKNLEEGYTQETYLEMICNKIDELNQLYDIFMNSLSQKENDKGVMECR